MEGGRGPGLNQGGCPHFGWGTINGARREDTGVKTRTMKWFNSYRWRGGRGWEKMGVALLDVTEAWVRSEKRLLE